MKFSKLYQYISPEYMNSMADNDDDFVAQMIEAYLASIPANLEKFSAAVDSNNVEDIMFYAHKLKGAFNFIGCTQVADVFLRVEGYCKGDGDMAAINVCMPEIIVATAGVTEELTHALASLGEPG